MKKSISVCIPVYNSERYLEECIKSVVEQTIKNFEIIVVNDGSSGVNELGYNCRKILKNIEKKYKLHINYIEHSENKGLLEARRTAVYAAEGEYVFNLDSDDKLPPDALENLYKVAIETGADIVHGKGDLFVADDTEMKISINSEQLEKIRNEKLRKITKVYPGVMENKNGCNDIFNGYIVDKSHCSFLWGKLFKRELYLEAFNNIPLMVCTMAEDVIQYFWLTYYAKKYVGIDALVYHYCGDTGISSFRIIDNMHRWEQVCSVASVFTAIYTSLKGLNIKLEQKQMESISRMCSRYVINNLEQLNEAVEPEMRSEAYEILCDYWGETFVHKVERLIEIQNIT